MKYIFLLLSITVLQATAQKPIFVKRGGGSDTASGSGGSGISGLTVNYLPVAINSTTLANSFLYQSSSNLGFGTTTPQTVMHLKYATNSDGLTIETTSTSGQASVRFLVPGSTYAIGASSNLNQTFANSFYIGKDGLFRMVITPNGLVGIGTKSPQGMLHVHNETGGNAALVLSNDSASKLVYAVEMADKNITTIPRFLRAVRSTGNNTETTLWNVSPSTGFMGIGPDSASYKLDVQGDIRGRNNAYILGLLGIGTATPLVRLDVAGQTRITANSTTVVPLQVVSTTRGIVPPQLTTAQRNAIDGAQPGEYIYNTDTGELNYWDATVGIWRRIVKNDLPPEYADNATALAGGLQVGDRYRTGDALKVVH